MDIINNNIKGNINTKICLISDIHYYPYDNNKKYNKIINNIKDNKPNYICITGDIIDKADISKLDLLYNFISDLSKITKVIICLGNHDLFSHHIYFYNVSFIENIKKIKNVYLLMDNEYIFDNIRFIGDLSTSQSFYSSCDKLELLSDLLKIIDNKYYNILLIHNPIPLLKKSGYKFIKNFNKLDLILAGHTHGGLLSSKIFGHFGLISPGKRLFPKNVRGEFKLEDNTLIISDGITKLSYVTGLLHKLNFLFPISINYIKIKK